MSPAPAAPRARALREREDARVVRLLGARRPLRALAEGEVDSALVAAAVELDRDIVAGLLVRDRRRDVLWLAHGLAVDLDDQVAAGPEVVARRGATLLEARLRRRAPGVDLL